MAYEILHSPHRGRAIWDALRADARYRVSCRYLADVWTSASTEVSVPVWDQVRNQTLAEAEEKA